MPENRSGTVDAMVERLYIGLNPALRRAAGRSVLAHLIDLIGRDIVAADGPPTVEAHYRLRHSSGRGVRRRVETIRFAGQERMVRAGVEDPGWLAAGAWGNQPTVLLAFAVGIDPRDPGERTW